MRVTLGKLCDLDFDFWIQSNDYYSSDIFSTIWGRRLATKNQKKKPKKKKNRKQSLNTLEGP